MSKELSFDYEYRYEDDEEGIPLPVKLTFGGRTVAVTAKVDPGAAVCLFRHEIGRRGWLRNLRLAVIDYDNLLYLSDYDS